MNFFRRMKGSITVFVTLILVPTIFFEGFMVDLARIKLYSNQAVMTADSYGEAVISMYDNLLKELYGLFAVTQDKEAMEQIKVLEEYMQSSFKPANNVIGWSHLQGIQDFMGLNSTKGFMPYQNAEIMLSYNHVPGSSLSNPYILGSQIGDFMKFRIAMTLLEDDDSIIEALDTIQKVEKDAEAIKKLNDVAKEAEAVMGKTKEYYNILKRLSYYPEYIRNINNTYLETKKEFSNITNSSSYQVYKDYILNEEAIEEALEHMEALEEGEELSEEEQEYIDMYNAYEEDEDAREDKLFEKFEKAIEGFIDSIDNEQVDFESFDGLVYDLEEKAKELEKAIKKLEDCRNSLQDTLEDENVSKKVKEGMQKELSILDKLFGTGGAYSADNYVNLAAYISKNYICNKDYELQAENISLRMEEIRDAYIECGDTIPEWYASLKESEYKNFMDIPLYEKLYRSLYKCFEEGVSSEAEERAKAKKKEAEKQQEEAAKRLKEEEITKARDIPKEFGFGDNGNTNNADFDNLIENAAVVFKENSFEKAGKRLLTKFYTVSYDFGMFSSRVTNVKEEEEAIKSLTGYKMASDINYLYQAELEYIFGGHNLSSANLGEARNRILAFRAIVNFAATYSITEINTAIESLSTAASAILPGLGLAVSVALRFAIAGIETVGDWDELKKGEGVVVIKNELRDLTSYEKFKSLIDLDGTVESSSTGLKLDYEQYLLVLIVFFTTDNQLYERTGNLITLNINHVQQNKGKEQNLTKLEFKLEEAYTAVDATCSIHLDFAVMPDNFVKQVIEENTYSAVRAFKENRYKFTVTRGY